MQEKVCGPHGSDCHNLEISCLTKFLAEQLGVNLFSLKPATVQYRYDRRPRLRARGRFAYERLESVQCGANDTLEFAFGRQFDPKAPQSFAGGIKQGVRRVRLFRTLVAKLIFQPLLVLRRREMPSGVLTNLRQVIIVCAAVPGIGVGGDPTAARVDR
jgi:hypothetical protein